MAQIGDYVLLRYALRGRPVYHERFVSALGYLPGLVAQYTTDGDHYVEMIDPRHNPDLDDVRVLRHRGEVPPGVPAAQIYPFTVAMTAALRTRLLRDGTRLVEEYAAGAGAPPAAPAGGAGAAALVAGVPPGLGVAGAGLALAGGGGFPAAPPPQPALAAPPGMVWVVAEDRGGLEKGRQLPVLPVGSLALGDRALMTTVSNEVVSVFAMSPADIPTFLAEDARTLPVKYDAQGDRKRTFAEAVTLMSQDDLPGGWPIAGPRSTMGTLKAIMDSGGSPEAEHDLWVRTARIPDGDRSVFEDEVISVVIQTLATVDQINLANLAGVELLMRRRALIREAHRLSPSSPDYSASHHYMGWARRREAGATHTGLTKFVAEQLRDEAAIAKETRRAREERSLRVKPAPKGKAGGKGGGSADG
jgi:hypothetical protein